jgi:hypothetical protein
MRFLARGLEDPCSGGPHGLAVPEKLTTAVAIKRLFEQFDAMLRQAG